MTFSIARNDLRGHMRSGVFIGLAVALLALLLAATAISSSRLSTFERERVSAEQVDREVWDSQGARNPHSAAHFARYAFKPVPELMAFDPGVIDYAGLALWMEAHNQNPAVFRRAEDSGHAGSFGDLSPAWILQYIAPLFLFLVLFASVAGEREQGTLRQMFASGITAKAVLIGKSLAGLALVVILVGSAFLLALSTGVLSDASVLQDGAFRTVGLVVTYSLFLASVAALAIGVSALCREKRTALTCLVTIWAVSFVLVPRLAAEIAQTLSPVPEATQITADLREASDAFYRDTDYREGIDRDILDRYDVESIEELPINYGGYSLQMSEKHAEPLFEAVYARLDEVYARQDTVLNAASLMAPVLALETASAGLAGTDRLHHRAFARDAELHRRAIVEQLNRDLMYNARPDQFDYANDVELWSEIPDFEHTPPTFGALARSYSFSLLLLLAYSIAAFVFAAFAVRRASRRIAA